MKRVILTSLSAVTEALRDGAQVYCEVTDYNGVSTQKVEIRTGPRTGKTAPARINPYRPKYWSFVFEGDFMPTSADSWALPMRYYAVV